MGEAHDFDPLLRDTDRSPASPPNIKPTPDILALFDLITDAILIVDAEERILFANQRTLGMTDYPRSEVEGRRLMDFTTVDQYQSNVGRFHKRLDGLPTAPLFDIEITARNGEKVPIEVSGTRILWDGAPAVLALFRNIAGRRAALRSLRDDRDHLEVVLRSMADGVLAVDAAGRIILMNAAAQQFTGRTFDSCRGLLLGKVLNIHSARSGQRIADPIENMLLFGSIGGQEPELVLHSQDGTRRIVECAGSPILHEDGAVQGLVLIIKDVSRQRQIERELLRMQKLDAIGALAGGIAHDFNNLLAGIMGNINLVQRQDGLPQDVYTRLRNVETQVRNATELTRQLLRLGRSIPSQATRCPIDVILRQAIEDTVRETDVQVQLDLAPSLPAVNGDHDQLRQALYNLIHNAALAMGGGGSVSVQAELTHLDGADLLPLPVGAYLRIDVRDTGCGIPTERIERIFEPYFSTWSGRTGLGLTAASTIVRNHAGHLTVTSAPGAGSTFTVLLPAAAHQRAQTEMALPQPRPSRTGAILVMDDQEVVRDVLQSMLTHLGFTVACVRDGAEAVACCAQRIAQGTSFDVAILDYTVDGGLGGVETLAELRKIDPSVRAIIATGYADDPILQQYAEHGFVAAVAKPFHFDDLQRVLGAALTTA